MNDEQLSVREIETADIDKLCQYWLGSSDEHLRGMGVDLNKLPDRETFAAMLASQIATPLEEKRSYCIIWEVSGQAVGHCNTHPTTFGEEAYMHLHLWDGKERAKGIGTRLLKITLPYFFERLKLKKLISEPYALNASPHKALEKAGFELVREYMTVPGSFSFEQPTKRWELTAERFYGENGEQRERLVGRCKR